MLLRGAEELDAPTAYPADTEAGLGRDNWNPSWGWASGAMISTLDDLHKWARALGAGRLISPASFRARKQFLEAPGEGGSTYGLGLMDCGGWIGHDGNLPGYITFPFYLPARRITVVVMLNSNANVLGAVGLMRAMTKIITPRYIWPKPPPE